ncbi:MAG: hypothetical protein P8K78_09205 [Pirellulales bacterium]|nr:hypothetical protein [Pirellulales bacterium]
MNIIGLNAFHGDAAAALVMDGQLVATLIDRHTANFPAQFRQRVSETV